MASRTVAFGGRINPFILLNREFETRTLTFSTLFINDSGCCLMSGRPGPYLPCRPWIQCTHQNELNRNVRIETSGKKQQAQDEEVQEHDELVACCLCYCAVDYSDKSYFCQSARDADSDLEGEQPLILPSELYDPNNALVFCDSCDRPYHQQCHFVPAIYLPRGDWNCFICTSAPKILEQKQKQTKKKANAKTNAEPSTWTASQLKDEIYQMNRPAGELERKWEYDVRNLKVLAFKTEMRRLQGAISTQMQNIRLAETTLNALTTSRRKTSVESMLKSQELCHALVKLSSAKLRVRQLLQSLDTYMKGDEYQWNILQNFLKQNVSETNAWFPLVQNAPRRMVPRLKDPSVYDCATNGTCDAGKVPCEVSMSNGNTSASPASLPASAPECKMAANAKPNSANNNNDNNTSSGNAHNNKQPQDNDDDSGISLDNLKCAVCFKGDSTDDNDLLMCDGQGCFRAHHMQCHLPIITQGDAQQEEDWFCPLCKTLAKLVADVQSEYTGDEWYSEEAGSVASWECVNDVFPEAPEEYDMAMKWKQNKIDAETEAYLKKMFGDDDHDQLELDENGHLGEEDDDDEEEDDDFDPTGTREMLQDDDADDGSDTSSKATLGELSIELKIGRQELDALSGGESSSSDEDEKHENGNTRRSRRVRSTLSSRTASRTTTDDEKSIMDLDAGKLDESNIILGKRRRRKIDYALLNDSMFGALSAADRAMIDDEVEFQYKAPARRETSSDSDDDDEESSDVSQGSGDNMGRDRKNGDKDAKIGRDKKTNKAPTAPPGRTKKEMGARKRTPRSEDTRSQDCTTETTRKHQSKKAVPTGMPRKDKSARQQQAKGVSKSKRPAPAVSSPTAQRRPVRKRAKTRTV